MMPHQIDPNFTCPFGSTNSNDYTAYVEIDAGKVAQENGSSAGVSVATDQILITCGIAEAVSCYYIQDVSRSHSVPVSGRITFR